ncbi:hypothetical protein DdX_10641 [Ditylenchus destructor]|uniref:Uncharacterized protein n=1 Tax=Ditylenchus destructor TaxID=166010 RepID=A0AAD4MZQ0_9BILA|nr:hypothetical protein DdX_10641 [Ditylenchus destructor]
MFNSKIPVDFYAGKVMNDIIPSGSEVVGTFANGIFYGTVALCNTTTYKFVTIDRDMPLKTKTVALKQFHSVAYNRIGPTFQIVIALIGNAIATAPCILSARLDIQNAFLKAFLKKIQCIDVVCGKYKCILSCRNKICYTSEVGPLRGPHFARKRLACTAGDWVRHRFAHRHQYAPSVSVCPPPSAVRLGCSE